MMFYFAESSKGCVRELNEDNYCCGTSHGGSCFYFAVADGMGGCNAGEIASKMAVDLFAERLPFAETNAEKTTGKFLTEMIEKANRRILNAADDRKNCSGMGTTAVIGVVDAENILTVGNAGDSRAYLFTNGELKKLTEDNTYVEDLLKCGMISSEEAENHPDKNVLTKSLGMEETVEPDIFTYRLKKGDRLIACTDGLYGMISDDIIKSTAADRSLDMKGICLKLVSLALEAGGSDNITVIAAETE